MLCVSWYFMLSSSSFSIIFYTIFIVETSSIPFVNKSVTINLVWSLVQPYFCLCPVHYLCDSFFLFFLQTSLKTPPVGAKIWTFLHFASSSSTLIINICTLEEPVTFFDINTYIVVYACTTSSSCVNIWTFFSFLWHSLSPCTCIYLICIVQPF